MVVSQLGDRQLYLHDPYFMGDDVLTLQTALATLGFICPVDGAFDIGTEHAVMDFQANMMLEPDGIVGEQTAQAIHLLAHAWRDKEIRTISTADLSKAKPASNGQEIVCVFGTDTLARAIAEHLANRAQVAAPAERIVSPASLEDAPPPTAYMLELSSDDERIAQLKSQGQPVLLFSTGDEFNAALQSLLSTISQARVRRATIEIKIPDANELTQQHQATKLLDAILQALG